MEYIFSDKISSLKPSAIREILKATSDPGVIPLAAGNPSAEAFPVEEVRKITAEILADDPILALQYGVTEGYNPLRELISSYMKKKHNIGRDFDNIIITAGAQQIMDLATKVLLNEGDTVICECPSFIGSLNCFRSYNAKLVGVPMESDGMDINALEQALKDNPRTAFIYVIPNFQNPTGITTSLEKRKAILELAYKYNVLVLEDNPYGDLRFAGEAIPSIRSLDKKGHVIYAGTFSKTLSPGLRVGYMCAESSIIQKAICALQVSTVHTSILSQKIVHQFVTRNNFEEHIANLQEIYRKKCELMLNCLKYKMPQSIKFTEPDGGLFVWGTLPDGDMQYFCKKAVENKVAVVPGNAFLVDEKQPTLSFRVNYSTPTDEQLKKGIEILGTLAEKL